MKEIVYKRQDERRQRLGELEKVAATAREELDMKRRELKKLIDSTHISTTTMFEQKQNHLLEMHVALRRELAEVHLERIRADGTWNRMYSTWLSGLGPSPGMPEPAYVPEEPR